jgi:hypothetical protein
VTAADADVDAARAEVNRALAAVALNQNDETLAARLQDANAVLDKRQAWLEKREKALEKAVAAATAAVETARAADAAPPPVELPAEFPPVARDVALKQLGDLARSMRYEAASGTVNVLEQHVRTLCGLLWDPVDKSKVPNLAVAATAGSGKTTLLRYLQQTADTVRYGAKLQADTNWLTKGWSAPRADVKCAPSAAGDAAQAVPVPSEAGDAAQAVPVPSEAGDAARTVPALRHVFVGFATFNQGGETLFKSTLDTHLAIERRCAWRILYDAGFASEWTDKFNHDLAQTAEALRSKITVAKSCAQEEVAIVFLIDEVTKIADELAQRALLDCVAAWQQGEVAAGRPSVSVVAGLSLYGVGDQLVTKSQRRLTALPLPPLVKVPRELAEQITEHPHLKRSRKLQLLGYISAAGGHPRTLEDVAAIITSHQTTGILLPVPGNTAQLKCVWDVFAPSIKARYSVDAEDLATAPQYELHRKLLERNCLQQQPTSTDAQRSLSRIVLTVTPSALFLADDTVWPEESRTGAGFPSYQAVDAVRELMKVTDENSIAKQWELALVGGLHLTAQCVLYASLTRSTPPVELHGSVLFKDLVPGAIIGCECTDLRYVVRKQFRRSVDRALNRADFQTLRDASCLHSQCPNQEAIEYAFAAERGNESLMVGAQHKFYSSAHLSKIYEWFDAVAKLMRGHMEGDKFRVLLCVTGLSSEALEDIKERASSKTDRLRYAIIINAASASQFFERLGVFFFVQAAKLKPG